MPLDIDTLQATLLRIRELAPDDEAYDLAVERLAHYAEGDLATADVEESTSSVSTSDMGSITGQRLTEEDGEPDLEASEALANLHAAVLNALEAAGDDTETYAATADDELDGSGWNLARSRQGGWHAVRDTEEVQESRRYSPSLTELLEAGGERAPKGGIELNGKAYRGGQFIPGKEIAKASPEDKAKLEKAKADSETKAKAKSAERKAKPVDRASLADRLSRATGGRKLLPSQERSAAASWRMLQRFHGDEALHRVQEIADAAEAALGKLDRSHPAAVRLRQRLGELAWMAGQTEATSPKDKATSPIAPEASPKDADTPPIAKAPPSDTVPVEGGKRKSRDGSMWKQAAAGGEVSPVNGQFYKGGHWMPIHGLSEKRPKTEKTGKGDAPPATDEEGKGRGSKGPRAEMTPDEIEAMKRRKRIEAIKSGPLESLVGINAGTGKPFRENPGWKNWQEFAASAGDARLRQIADALKPTEGDAALDYEDELKHPQGFAAGAPKKHHREYPASAEAYAALSTALRHAKTVEDVERVSDVLTGKSAPTAQPQPSASTGDAEWVASSAGKHYYNDIVTGDLIGHPIMTRAGWKDEASKVMDDAKTGIVNSKSREEAEGIHKAMIAKLDELSGKKAPAQPSASPVAATPDAGAKAGKGGAKEPWEMTGREFAAKGGVLLPQDHPAMAEADRLRRAERDAERELLAAAKPHIVSAGYKDLNASSTELALKSRKVPAEFKKKYLDAKSASQKHGAKVDDLVSHKQVVADAVAAGKPVPDNVLADVRFSGTDSQGRQWVNGELVAGQEQPQAALPTSLHGAKLTGLGNDTGNVELLQTSIGGKDYVVKPSQHGKEGAERENRLLALARKAGLTDVQSSPVGKPSIPADAKMAKFSFDDDAWAVHTKIPGRRITDEDMKNPAVRNHVAADFAFNWIAGNFDRNDGNFLVDDSGKVHSVDFDSPPEHQPASEAVSAGMLSSLPDSTPIDPEAIRRVLAIGDELVKGADGEAPKRLEAMRKLASKDRLTVGDLKRAGEAAPATSWPTSKDEQSNSILDVASGLKDSTGRIPIHALRQEVSKRFGSEAATPQVLDKLLQGLRRDGRVRLVPVGDPTQFTPDQLKNSMEGAGETLVYLEMPQATTAPGKPSTPDAPKAAREEWMKGVVAGGEEARQIEAAMKAAQLVRLSDDHSPSSRWAMGPYTGATAAEVYRTWKMNNGGKHFAPTQEKPKAEPKPAAPRHNEEELRKEINQAAQQQRQTGLGKHMDEYPLADFMKKYGAMYGGGDRAKEIHRNLIAAKVAKGEAVAPDVLADYPDLTPKQDAPQAATSPADTPGTPEHFKATVLDPMQRSQGGKPLYPQQVERLAARYNARHGTSLDVTRKTPPVPTGDELKRIHAETGGKAMTGEELQRRVSNKPEEKPRDAKRDLSGKPVVFPKPIVGPSGARLLSYEWKWQPFETVDARGEDVVRKVSDWEQAEKNIETGQNVVHHFHVETPEGERKTVSLESALKMMGYAGGGGKNVKSLAASVKTLAQLKMNLQLQQERKQEYDTAFADASTKVDAMKMPDVVREVSPDGKRVSYKMGDHQVWDLSGAATIPPERLNLLRSGWRSKRISELMPPELNTYEARGVASKVADLEKRLAKAQERVDSMASAASDTSQQ